MIISQALNEARLQAVIDFLSLGTDNATLSIYDSGDVRLVDITLADPVGVVASGVLTLTASEEAIVLNSGIAAYGKVFNGNGDFGWQCAVTDLAGDGPIKLSQIQLYAGGFTRLVGGALA